MVDYLVKLSAEFLITKQIDDYLVKLSAEL